MKPNPYKSTNAVSDAKGGHRIGLTVLRIIGAAMCVIPISLAAYAWCTHWRWQNTGAYSRNSFPMNKFAMDLTLLSVVCVGIVAITWSICALTNRKPDR